MFRITAPGHYMPLNSQNIENYLHFYFIKMEKKPRTKSMIIGKFISLLLIFRPYLHEISGLPYTGVILSLLVIKKIKEGFTIGTSLQIISALLILGGDLFQITAITYCGIASSLLNYFLVEPVLYKFP